MWRRAPRHIAVGGAAVKGIRRGPLLLPRLAFRTLATWAGMLLHMHPRCTQLPHSQCWSSAEHSFLQAWGLVPRNCRCAMLQYSGLD